MKKSVLIRVLAALGGVTLLAAAACVATEGFFGVPVTAMLGGLLSSGHVLAVLAKLLLLIGLLVLAGAVIVCAVPRKPKEQDGFIMQKGENGAIGISVKAIEKQVRACVARYDVIAGAEVSIRECRDGLIILLNVDQVAGVNIPLSVGMMQKQIKQYVSGCTGVDVHEVRVMVENNTTNVVASPFAVQEAEYVPGRPAEESAAEEPVQPAAEEAPVQAAPAPAAPVAAPVILPEIPPMPAAPVTDMEDDERPLHQRPFGAEEQPVFVPAPPEMIAEPVEEETAPEAAEEPEAPQESVEEESEAAAEADIPLDAAEAGAAYSEELWADEEPPEAAEEDQEDEEEQAPSVSMD